MVQKPESESARKSYNHPCHIAQALDVLGDRWTLLILRDLMAGLHRYTDILENCAGMSPNVLSDRLKRLEADGLVSRIYYKELPPRVEYNLTEKGWAVRPVLLALIDFSKSEIGSAEPFEAHTTTDFAVRVVPAFSFKPERAGALAATMAIEIADCSDCNSWSFTIAEGQIHPRRNATARADIFLKTTSDGFFRFIRGQASAEDVGELLGDRELAASIQACFIEC